MLPKDWCGGTLVVTVLGRTFFKESFGKDSRLWEAINATANFEVDPTILHMVVKVIFIDEFLRNVAEIDADISKAVQWSLEVEVADVEGDIFEDLLREDTVDDEFEYIKQCSFGYHVAWIFDVVTANFNAVVIGILLFRAERAHKFRGCDFFPVVHGDEVIVDDIEYVCAFYALAFFVRAGTDALEKTAEFICIRCGPCWY